MILLAFIGICLGIVCTAAGIYGALLNYANEKDSYIDMGAIKKKELFNDDEPRKAKDISQTGIRSIRFR